MSAFTRLRFCAQLSFFFAITINTCTFYFRDHSYDIFASYSLSLSFFFSNILICGHIMYNDRKAFYIAILFGDRKDKLTYAP